MDRTKTKIDVKLALAEKYERLQRVAGSTPKRKKFAFEAARYRRQLEQLCRDAGVPVPSKSAAAAE
jgi:hypothetical protein